MARIAPGDHAKLKAMLRRRLRHRENPFLEDRPATLDDIVFLPANLSRLVIDPYREACRVATGLGGKLELDQPFFVSGFDDAPSEVRESVAAGLAESKCGYIGTRPMGSGVPWLQIMPSGNGHASPDAAGFIVSFELDNQPTAVRRLNRDQVLGVAVARPELLDRAISFALDSELDFVLLDAIGGVGTLKAESSGVPDLSLLRDAVLNLRARKQEEVVGLVYYGGARSGTDAAKLIAMGASAVVFGVPIGLAAGGAITDIDGVSYASNYTDGDRRDAVANILKANLSEASMMARCTGKTNLMNLEPEDLRTITLATSEVTGIPLVGVRT